MMQRPALVTRAKSFFIPTVTIILLMVIMVSLSSAEEAGQTSRSADSNAPIGISFLTGPSDNKPLDITLDYLNNNRSAYGLTGADLSDIAIDQRYVDMTGATQIELRQRLNGIEVYNGMILSNVARDGSIINLHNQFVSALTGKANTTQPEISAENAVNAAASNLQLTPVDLAIEEVIGGPSAELLFNTGGISRTPIPAFLIYQPLEDGTVRLAWDVEIYTIDSPDWWSIRIDAVTGKELDRFSYTIHEDFIQQAIDAHGPDYFDNRRNFDDHTPVQDQASSESAANTYRVYPWPIESPNYASPAPPADARSLVSNPAADASALGSPFGWHATSTLAWTTTQGNNVDAQKAGTESDCGVTRDCDHTLDLTVDPTVGSNVDAAIDNLFYWNNVVHDVWYNYGFTESMLNFQEDNNGQGAAGSDSVTANAQLSTTCNAFMTTPVDGNNPAMDMYICDIATPSRDGSLDNGVVVHEYTHGISNRQTGGSSVSCLGNTEQMGEGWSDWYALMMTIEPGDSGTDNRPIGTWLFGQGPAGGGIRQYPYSTNLSVNPHTYGNVGGVSVPHGVGSIWAAMLWEVTWNLIADGSQNGLDPDIYEGTGGNNLAMQLVNRGLQLQPCSPGFVDGRNAILQADQEITGGANQCVIWDAFAKRGLGFSASQGSSNSVSDGTAAFDLPLGCPQTLKITKSVDQNPVPAGSTLKYTLEVRNDTVDTLTNVVVTDTIQANQTYIGGSATCGGSESGGIVTFPLGSMAPTAVAACTFDVLVDVGLVSIPTFFDDFESGLANWTMTGLWNTETDSDSCGSQRVPFPSPSTAAYYGQDGSCTYDTGATNTGALTMNNDITIPSGVIPRLKFSYFLGTEQSANFDKAIVEISTNSGATWTQLIQLTDSNWQEIAIDLSSYAGSDVRLRYRFDSVDNVGNAFFGLMIDDVEIIEALSISNTACVAADEGDNDCDTVAVDVSPPAVSDFTIDVTPATLNVCQSAAGAYTINVGSLHSFTDPVTLSITGEPAGTSANFSSNPVNPTPGSSTLTIGSTGAAATGAYNLTVTGTGSSGVHSDNVTLNILPGAPDAITLSAPSDGATGVSATPTYSWSADPDATNYFIEIATDSGFGTIVDSANGATTSYSGAPLSASTTYYWRVTASNGCGTAATSATFSFTTGDAPACVVYTSTDVPKTISSSGTPTVSSILDIANSGTIIDVNVLDLAGTHTWINDLDFNLTSPASTAVQIMAQSCDNQDNFDLNLDDAGTGPASAWPCPPTNGGTYQPSSPLAAFNGEEMNGIWTLSIHDNVDDDGGSLDSWGLEICAEPPPPLPPAIEVPPSSLSSTQIAGVTTMQTLTISNTGGQDLVWAIEEEPGSAAHSSESEGFSAEPVINPRPNMPDAQNSPLTVSMEQFLADQTGTHALDALSATPCIAGDAGGYPCNNVDLMAFMPLADIGGGNGNDIWGWTGCTNREFALMGRTSGTSFVEITDPENPVYLGNLPTHTNNSLWRDVKTYADHAFIVSEAGSHGMQVFDLTQLCSVASPPVSFSNTAHYNGFGNAHNIVINEDSGFAYGVGTNTCAGGLHMVDISTPTSPSNAGCFSSDGYTHDAQCVNYSGPDTDHAGKEICFNSNEDTMTIVDVTNKSTTTQLSRTGYASSRYTHQAWLTEDHAFLLLNDELDEQNNGHNTRTRIWDVSNLDSPTLIGQYDGPTTAIDHNLYIKGDFAYEANYRAGLRILDISDIASSNLTEAAYFDIYPSSDGASFNGAWSNYPFFDSGIVIVSGIEQGLFVLKPLLEAAVCDNPSDITWASINPLNGTTVPTDSANVDVMFDSTGLSIGTYAGTLCINSNDPVSPLVKVPISLIVEAPTAIELARFEAQYDGNGTVSLNWETTVEIDNAGFNVYRSNVDSLADPNAIVKQVNQSLVPAQGSLGQGASYSLSDENVAGGVWFYFLEDVDLHGIATHHGPVVVETATPTGASLTRFSGDNGSGILPLALTTLLSVMFVLFVAKRRKSVRT